ncbi:MAG: hypothetical protein AAF220_05365 [Pseudomonadota bacterium]
MLTPTHTGQFHFPIRLFAALAALLLVLLGGLTPGSIPAVNAQELELRRVILSTGGVAYLEHEAQIDGDTDLRLPIPLDDVDDVLKSLVVFDGSGSIASVSLPGREPLDEVFRNLSFPQEALGSTPALLAALIGTEISVNGRTAATGRLLSVEPFQEHGDRGDAVVLRHRLTLMTSLGIKQTVLEDVKELRFEDERLQEEIDRALSAAATLREKDRRTLTLSLRGGGARTIAVGYVIDAPLWKSAYRLVLPPEKGGEKGHLQGWAILENMTGIDWDGVTLTLVSGNPVAYRQSLYEPYRLERPELPVAVMGRILPRRDDGAVPTLAADATLGSAAMLESAPAPRAMARANKQSSGGIMGMFSGASSASLAAPSPNTPIASEAATQVMFAFPEPLKISAGNSLMVPIIDRQIPAEPIFIYQPDRQPRHPFAAVRLSNDGASSLPPGILTLYGSRETGGTGGFVGDAEFAALPGDETRFLSFALDEKTIIDQDVSRDSVVGTVAIERGVLRREIKDVAEVLYTIRAPARDDRTIVLEHPRRPDWKLVLPTEDVEQTESHFRIPVTVAAGEVKRERIVMERSRSETVRLITLSNRLSDPKFIQTYFGGRIDAKTRRALDEMAKLQRAVATADRSLRDAEQRRSVIVQDQAGCVKT